MQRKDVVFALDDTKVIAALLQIVFPRTQVDDDTLDKFLDTGEGELIALLCGATFDRNQQYSRLTRNGPWARFCVRKLTGCSWQIGFVFDETSEHLYEEIMRTVYEHNSKTVVCHFKRSNIPVGELMILESFQMA